MRLARAPTYRVKTFLYLALTTTFPLTSTVFYLRKDFEGLQKVDEAVGCHATNG